MKDGRTYRAHIGEQSFDIAFQDGHVLINEEPVACTFEQVTDGYYTLLIDGQSLPVLVEPDAEDRLRVSLANRRVEVRVQDERALLLERFGLADPRGSGNREIHAPMPGLVLRVLVEPGQPVQEGAGLVVLEAMKMENELRAPNDGTIKAVHVVPGDAVGKNALLVEFEA